MGGALIQLVSKGIENIYLSENPQITFFKVVYRRHTNFSREHKILTFSNEVLNFGTKVTCNIPLIGDLVNQMYLVITLPSVNKMVAEENNEVNEIYATANGSTIYSENKFAWVRNIGYAIIKTILIEIGGRKIDTQYGEWLYLWNELIGPKDKQYDKMIGNVPELYNFSNGKEEYTLYIPLQFWFCKCSGLALPLIGLELSNVKISIELQDLEKCYIKTPTYYIECNDDVTAFQKYEMLYQNYDNQPIYGLFDSYDSLNKRLYYTNLSQRKFKGKPSNEIESNKCNYKIIGKISNYIIKPKDNIKSQLNIFDPLNLSLKESYLLADYIYLDSEEREIFRKESRDYIIEQLYYTPNVLIDSVNNRLKISLNQPTKLLCWIVQLNDIANSLDYFNYTDSFERILIGEKLGELKGKSLVNDETIMFNSLEIMSSKSYKYFNYCQPYQHFKYGVSEGINVCSLSLFPQEIQPSGSCNFSRIDTSHILMNVKDMINVNNNAYFRCYGLAYNILKVSNQLGGLMFIT